MNYDQAISSVRFHSANEFNLTFDLDRFPFIIVEFDSFDDRTSLKRLRSNELENRTFDVIRREVTIYLPKSSFLCAFCKKMRFINVHAHCG